MIHPTDHNILGEEPNNEFKTGQELEFDVNERIIRGKFIRYDIEDKEQVFIETTHDHFRDHGSIQRVHLSWLVNNKQPTGILKELMELKRYNEDLYGCTFEHIKGNYVLWSDVEAIINKYLNQ